MNELFERYCEVCLRKNSNYSVWAGYGDQNLGEDFKVRPDFLVTDSQNGWIVDAKYKPNWSWNKQDHRPDVYQVMAYSRHRGVLRELGNLMKRIDEPHPTVVILGPGTPLSDEPELALDLAKTARNTPLNAFQVQLVKLDIPLPNLQ